MPKTKDYEKLYKKLKNFVHSRFNYYKGVHANLTKKFDGTTAKAKLVLDVNAKLDVLGSLIVFIDGVEEQCES